MAQIQNVSDEAERGSRGRAAQLWGYRKALQIVSKLYAFYATAVWSSTK